MELVRPSMSMQSPAGISTLCSFLNEPLSPTEPESPELPSLGGRVSCWSFLLQTKFGKRAGLKEEE